MDFVIIIVVAAVTFGLCFLVDKGFEKMLKKQAQRHSGLAVRLSKKYGSIGLIMAVLGVAGVLFGDSWLMYVASALVILIGLGLVVYYMTYGVYYDEDTFLVTSFGKKSTVYRYSQIRCQQLYNSYGQIVIELQTDDGKTFQLQAGMTGVYAFMDKAFDRWCTQKGISRDGCSFHDPDNSCWFPPAQEE